jgi:hypothetical protein
MKKEKDTDNYSARYNVSNNITNNEVASVKQIDDPKIGFGGKTKNHPIGWMALLILRSTIISLRSYFLYQLFVRQ